jgi:hypothetical protein
MLMRIPCLLLLGMALVWTGVQAGDPNEYRSGPLNPALTVAAPLEPAEPAGSSLPGPSNLPGRVRWIWATLGSIGNDLLASGDLSGDGRAEVVVATNMYWGHSSRPLFVLGDELNRVVCQLEEIPWTILDHHIFRPGPGPAADILIASEQEILLVDGRNCRIRQRHPFPLSVVAAGFGDVNGNGIPDVAYSDGADLFVAPWNDFSSPIERRGFGGSRLIVDSLGRADGDDIGVAAELLFVLRGDNLETITEISGHPLNHVAFGDVTGDGVGNVVLGATWNDGIRVFDLDHDAPVLEHPVFDLARLATSDVNGNGQMEIVYGEAQWGDVHVLAADGTVLHTLHNPSHGISNLLPVDFQGNGQVDVLWGNRQLFRGDLATESTI